MQLFKLPEDIENAVNRGDYLTVASLLKHANPRWEWFVCVQEARKLCGSE